MNRIIIKRVLAYLLVAVLLTIGVSLTFVRLADMETRKSWVTHAVSRVLHRDLSIAGDFHLKFGRTIELLAEDVSLQNPTWDSQPVMFSADRVELQLDVFSVLVNDPEYRVRLEAPEVYLETDAEGKDNWHFADSGEQQNGSGPRAQWDKWLPKSVSAKAVKIHFLDGQTGKRDLASLDTLALGYLDGQWHFDADGRFNKLPVTLKSNLAVFDDQVEAGYSMDVQWQLGRLALNAKGQVRDLSNPNGPSADINWVMHAPSLRVLDGQMVQHLPDIGPFRASGKLHGDSGQYAIGALQAEISDALVGLEVSGEIGDLLGGKAISLEINLNTNRLPDLVRKLGMDIQHRLPVNLALKGRLSGDISRLEARGLTASLAGQELKLNLEGDIGSLLALEEIDIGIKGEIGRLSAAGIELPAHLQSLGPFKLAAKLEGSREKLALTHVDVRMKNKMGQLRAIGGIAELNRLKGIALELEGKLTDPARWLKQPMIGVKGIGPVQVHVLLNEMAGSPGVLAVDAKLSSKAISAKVKGKLDELLGKGEIRLALELKAAELADIGELIDQELPNVGPVDFRAMLSMNENEISLTSLKATAGGSDLQGDLTLVLADPARRTLPGLSGNLKSHTFNLRELHPRNKEITIEQGGMAVTGETAGIDSGERFFPADKLPFDWLQQYRVDIDLGIEQLLDHNVTLDGVSTKLQLRQGILQIRPFAARIDNKPVTFDLYLDASAQPAKLKLQLTAEQFKLNETVESTALISGGMGSVDINLAGEGNSIASIMGSLNGHAIFSVKDAVLLESMLHNMGADVLTKLNPLTGGKIAPALECAAAYFEIKDGKATTPRGLVAKLTHVTWMGSGEIDLNTERINIVLKPKPRKGLGVNLNQLSSLVLVAGTLNNPRIQLDPEGVVGATAYYAAAVSTGGLSLLLKGLFDKSRANEAVCEYVIAAEKEAEPTGR